MPAPNMPLSNESDILKIPRPVFVSVLLTHITEKLFTLLILLDASNCVEPQNTH